MVSPKIKGKTQNSTITNSMLHRSYSPVQKTRQRKGQDWKEVNLSLSPENLITCAEHLLKSTKKLPELMWIYRLQYTRFIWKLIIFLQTQVKEPPRKACSLQPKTWGKRQLEGDFLTITHHTPAKNQRKNSSFFDHRVRHKFQLLPPASNYPGDPRWNFKLAPVHREREQERGRLLQLVGGRFNKKQNLPGLSLVVEKPNRSPHLFAWVLSLYRGLNGVKLYV